MKFFPTLLAFLFFLAGTQAPIVAQQSLEVLDFTAFSVQYSPGHRDRAGAIARRIEQAMGYHESLLGFRPDITLLVLSPDDWTTHTPYQVVYGMPHYVVEQKKLVLAAEDNPFWRSFLPPLEQLPPDLQQLVRAAYGDSAGGISAQPFFDLLAIHELGHAFHYQAELQMQRNWMGELFCNIFLHTYVAEREPSQLPALTVFPKLVTGAGTGGYTYTTLPEIHDHYMELAETMPRNYGWYQCRFHVAAAAIYDAEGAVACRRLWDALRHPTVEAADEDLVTFLRERDAPGVADVIAYWERDTIR